METCLILVIAGLYVAVGSVRSVSLGFTPQDGAWKPTVWAD